MKNFTPTEASVSPELAGLASQSADMLKSHIKGFTRKDGAFVAEHDDKRTAAQAPLSSSQVHDVVSKHDMVRKGADWKHDGEKVPASDVGKFPEFSHKEVYGHEDKTSPAASDFSKEFAAKGHQGFVLKHPDGKRSLVDTQGGNYARYHAPVENGEAAKLGAGHPVGQTLKGTDAQAIHGGREAARKKFDGATVTRSHMAEGGRGLVETHDGFGNFAHHTTEDGGKSWGGGYISAKSSNKDERFEAAVGKLSGDDRISPAAEKPASKPDAGKASGTGLGAQAKALRESSKPGDYDHETNQTAADHMEAGDHDSLKATLRSKDTAARDHVLDHIHPDHWEGLGYNALNKEKSDKAFESKFGGGEAKAKKPTKDGATASKGNPAFMMKKPTDKHYTFHDHNSGDEIKDFDGVAVHHSPTGNHQHFRTKLEANGERSFSAISKSDADKHLSGGDSAEKPDKDAPMAKALLFTSPDKTQELQALAKAHVDGYVRKDGVTVKAYETLASQATVAPAAKSQFSEGDSVKVTGNVQALAKKA